MRMKKYAPIFYVVSLANLCFFLGNSFFILLPVYLKSLGASETYIGIINNIDKIFLILAAFALGSLIKGHDRVRMLRQGYVLLLCAYGSYLFIDSLAWYIPFIRVLHGIGFSVAMIMGSTIVFESVAPEDATEAIGIYGITGAITNAVSPAVGEFLLSRGCRHHVLFMLSCIFIAASLALTFRMPQISQQQSGDKKNCGSIGLLFRQPQFTAYMLATFVFGGGFGVIITFLPNFIRTDTALNFSWFFVTYTAVLIAIRLFFMKSIATAPINRLVAAVFGVGAAMNVLLNFPGTVAWLVTVGVMYGITHGVLYPVLNAHVVNLAPQQDRGTANALFSAIFNGGMMAFAFCLGFVIDSWGNYLAAFNICAVASVAAAAMIAILNYKMESFR
jgi:predicted MFS family arabinose efflux permease